MKKILNEILIVAILLFFIIYSGEKSFSIFDNTLVEATGDLFVDFGSNPLFTISNISPGQSISKTIHIYNDSNVDKLTGIKGIKKVEMKNISHQLLITISENGKELYGGIRGEKNLEQFFKESTNLNGVTLSAIHPRKDTQYIVTVTFKKTAGNEYQNTILKFDMQIGVVVVIPKDCNKLHLNNTVIYGTKRNDNLQGTEGNDLIIGFEGNDSIDGKGGNDCILGGEGRDTISGGKGKDMCEGEIIRNCEGNIHF